MQILIGLIAVVAVWIILGFAAVRTLLGMLIIFMFPAYIILRNFELANDERIIFSFFLGFGLLPVIVFFLNLVVPSLRWSIVISFALSLGTGLMLQLTKKTKTSEA
ncbi:MAG: hypothetical protein ABIF10_06905 [Candidatus Woesearchaeota archaeon]